MSLTRTWSRHWTDPHAPAITLGDVTLSHGELQTRIRRAVGWLREQDVYQGDIVALQLPKGLAFIEIHLAALAIGAITLPLNDGYTPSEVAWMLRDAGASLAIAPEFGDPTIRRVDPGSVHEALDAAPEQDLPDDIDLEAIGVLCYTSGTTGRPKGARIRQRNIRATVEALHEAWRWAPGDVLIHALPLFHVHGLFVAQHGALRAGAHAVWLDRFSPEAVLRAIADHHATIFMGVPTHYHRLLEAGITGRHVASVRLFTSGSAGLPASEHRSFHARTGHEIVERYGMTEVGIVLSNPLDGPRKPGSVGLPLPGVRARVVDEATRAPVLVGEVGELEIAGPSVFAGYHERPEDTESTLVDGWMRTGDLATADPDGWIRLVGRRSELVIRGGLNVYPAEVEAALLDDPEVLEAAVFGVADPDLGERVHAAAVLVDGARAEDVLARVAAVLAPFKRPEQIHALAELPRNAMGKVQKPVLRARFAPR